jgi:hypothetical protein
MRSFGLWPARQGLIAVALDKHGRQARPIAARRTDAARCAMLDYLASLPAADIVVAHALLDSDLPPHCFDHVLRDRDRTVWIAPAELAEAIAAAAGQRAVGVTSAPLTVARPRLRTCERSFTRATSRPGSSPLRAPIAARHSQWERRQGPNPRRAPLIAERSSNLRGSAPIARTSTRLIDEVRARLGATALTLLTPASFPNARCAKGETIT